jgi:hypothetical protein
MRKLLISLAAAGAALVVASPASAQYYGGQQYGQGYGYNGYNNGYGNNYGSVRALQARIDAVQWQIKRLDRYNGIGDRQADQLRAESRGIERRLHQAGRYGLNPYEAQDIQVRIARLEQRVQYASSNRYGRYGRGHDGHGYNGDYDRHDRDHHDRDHHGDRDDD